MLAEAANCEMGWSHSYFNAEAPKCVMGRRCHTGTGEDLLCKLKSWNQCTSSTKSGAELRVIIDKVIFRIVYTNLSVVAVGPQVHTPLSFPG
jgi:hypothetical protein